MDLRGKKINFLGDSITEGHGVDRIENTYPEVLRRMEGLAEARNYGISGTRIAVQMKPSDEPRWDLDFISRVDEMDADADAVVVFGGTNDYGHGDAPIGSMDDRTPYTFYGALHVLYNKLFERFPNALIVVLTPLHRDNEQRPTGDGYKAPTLPLKGYVDIIREVAEYYSVPVLDLYSCYGVNPIVPVLKEKFMPDGLHPNAAGQKILADRIAGFLKTL